MKDLFDIPTEPKCGFSESDLATLDAARSILQRSIVDRDLITSWHALEDYLRVTVAPQRAETARVIYLDTKNRLIRDEVAGAGTINHTPLYVREIMRRALALDAAAIILYHNHPSGDPTPSKDDVTMSKAAKEAGEVLGVTVHDSVIVTAEKITSLRAMGEL